MEQAMMASVDPMGTLVLDIGSYTSRAGVAGSLAPTAVECSLVGAKTEQGLAEGPAGMDLDGAGEEAGVPGIGGQKRIWHASDWCRSDGVPHLEVQSCTSIGAVQCWDMWDSMVERLLARASPMSAEREQKSPPRVPVLLAENILTPASDRERMAEILFEAGGAPSVAFVSRPVLSLIASGRRSGISLHCGHSGTVVCPVEEGIPLAKCLTWSPVGGRMLSDVLLGELRRAAKWQKVEVRPRCCFQRVPKRLAGTVGRAAQGFKCSGNHGLHSTKIEERPTSSFAPSYLRASTELDILADAKSLLLVHSSGLDCSEWQRYRRSGEERAIKTVTREILDLPDGSRLGITGSRAYATEHFFNPQFLQVSSSLGQQEAALGGEAEGNVEETPSSTLPDIVASTLGRLMRGSKKEGNVLKKLNPIVVDGGSSLLPGFCARLQNEIGKKGERGDVSTAGQAFALKDDAPSARSSQHHAAFIGGSIFASLGGNQAMWLSKQQYDEVGPRAIHSVSPAGAGSVVP